MANRSGERVPDHYAKLGISADCSYEQMIKAAKEMRMKMHPDRRKWISRLSEEEMMKIDVDAASVGQAADVLSDPDLRLDSSTSTIVRVKCRDGR